MSDLATIIKQEVNAAVHAAIVSAIDKHYTFTTTATNIVRAKKIGKGAKHTEMFPIRIDHRGTDFGRDATISMDGCTRSFKVEQDPNRPQHKRSWQTKLSSPPRWSVWINNEGGSPGHVENTENFEAAVQSCVVALIGHVYYDGA